MHLILFSMINYVLAENALDNVPSNRIIGGNEALIENFPFMVSVVIKIGRSRTIFSGGASIISKHWVITAAHCIFDFNDGIVSGKHAFVRANTSYWKDDYAFSRDHLVTESIIHEEYINDKEDYDIGLLLVDEPFDGKYEMPIPYARNDHEYVDNASVTTLGWGTTQPKVEPYTVRQLRQVDINLLQTRLCRDIYEKADIHISIRMVCACAPDRDACVNDSGGPLVQHVDANTYTLIGLVSWGIECASKKYPGVYTKLSEFDIWINESIHHHHKPNKRTPEYQSYEDIDQKYNID